jgi:proton-translocating NADH-quinone oxidoreductase chain N
MVNPVLLIVVPLGAAFLLPLAGLVSRKSVKYVPILVFLFNLTVALTLLGRVQEKPIQVHIGGFPPPFGINLAVGPAGAFLAALIALVGLLVAIYGAGYIRQGPREQYHTLYLLLLTGATGVVLTGDLFNLFVFYEILCVSSYALVAYPGDRPALESSVKYLIQGAVGASLVLIGIGLIYGLFGTLNMADIARQIDSVETAAIFVPLVLMITGFGVEAAVFPLNAWLPDAHSSAPASISAILSGIAIEVGLYAVIRVVFTLFGALSLLPFLGLLGVLTLLVGEICAFAQDNLKRMLAFSSIGQIGLILFAFSLGTPAGVAAGLFQLLSHTLSKALLFLAAGYLVLRSGSLRISSLAGMGKRMPLTSFAFAVGAFSLVGMPPGVGFAGKFLIVRAALARGEALFTVLIALALVGTIIEGAYFFRVIQAIYFRNGEAASGREEAPLTALLPLSVLVVLIIVLGIYPRLVGGFLDSAAAEFIHRMDYIRNVLL